MLFWIKMYKADDEVPVYTHGTFCVAPATIGLDSLLPSEQP